MAVELAAIFERNPPMTAMRGPLRRAALDTMRMRFDVPDAAPTDRLNRIVWGMVKGWQSRYPAVRKSVFAPFAIDVDDGEREGVRDRH